MSCHRLLSIALVGSLAACGGPTAPGSLKQPPPSQTVDGPVTQPIAGTVSVVGGGPVSGVPVSAPGAAATEPYQTVSDTAGHYSLPSVHLRDGSGAWVSAYRAGYVSGSYPLALLTAPGQSQQIDIHLQPELTLTDQLEFDLSNDDIAYGYDGDPSFGLPPRRWPVKVITASTSLPGSLEFRADWSGPAPLRIWLERRYLEDSRESQPVPGVSAAIVTAPLAWLRESASSVTLTVGVPISSIGLPEPAHVRLTVRQADALSPF